MIIMSSSASAIRRKLRSEHRKALTADRISTGDESSRLKRKKVMKRNNTGNMEEHGGVGEYKSTVVVNEDDDSEEGEFLTDTTAGHELETGKKRDDGCLGWSISKNGGSDNEEDDEDLELESEVFGNESLVMANFFAHDKERKQTITTHHGDSDVRNVPLYNDIAKKDDVWVDDDESDLNVDFSDPNNKRLRKLRRTQEEKVLTGKGLQMRLRDRFVNSHVLQYWAHTREEGEYRDIGRKEDDDLDKLMSDAEPLVLQDRYRKTALLQPRRLDIRRLKDANQQDTCQSVVRAVSFHPSGELLLTGGLDKALRIFRIDGENNPKAHGVHFSDMPIHRAKFLGPGGDEVICSGTKPYFYSYDVESG